MMTDTRLIISLNDKRVILSVSSIHAQIYFPINNAHYFIEKSDEQPTL